LPFINYIFKIEKIIDKTVNGYVGLCKKLKRVKRMESYEDFYAFY